MNLNRHMLSATNVVRLPARTVAVLGTVLLALQCVEAPNSPVLPTLDVQGSIPLLDRRFTMADFTSKDSAFVKDGSGGFVYSSYQEFDPISLDSLSVQPEASSQQVVLGTFQVQTPAIPPVDFDLGLPSPGLPYFLPAGSVALPPFSMPPLSGFEYIEFESGTLTLQIQNDLPVDVSFPNPLIVRNDITSPPVDTSTVASFPVSGTISANGGSGTQVSDLSGVRLKSSLYLPSITVDTPGGSGTIATAPRLRMQLTISNATVRAAKAVIPSQSLLSFADSTFVIDDSVSLSTAFFKSGSFSVQIQNNVNVDIDVYLQFTELQDAVTGQPFAITHTFNGVGTFNVPVDASQLKFQTLVDSIGTRATFTAGVSTISNADPSREIFSTDNVVVQIIPGPPLDLQSVTGRIKPTTVDFSTGASGFDFGDVSSKFQGDITFDSVQIALGFQSSSGFPIDYDLYFIAMNRSTVPAKIDSLIVPPPQGSAQRRIFPSINQNTRIVLDNSSGLNTFLSKFFPSVPDTFIARGSILVNPPDVFPTPLGKQTIYDTSQVYSSVDMTFPIQLGISNASVWDTVDIGTEEKFPKGFASSSQKGTMYFDIENGMPLSFSFRAALLRRGVGGTLDTLLFIPTDGPRLVDAATVDGNGNVTSSAVSRFAVSLTSSDLQQFESADLMWIELNVATSNGGSIIKVQDSQMIKVRASANIVYRVSEE